ncbi:hypothetical protein [Parabacteroides sp. PF5-6]|uniref:hypothetical protein n=1 Tax=Parabacteroides sp. PF5-6 TaxID=1742403 RepID=UPI002406D8B1|nr:hypothetical protein [Parabacteroides sp. PF5-6]MDF9829919.1 hypothetical protein [Parabacteroides sp. PF5-6]
MKKETIRYIIYALLLVIAFAGCNEAEVPVPEDDEWVAIELVGLDSAVEVTRGEGEIDNATIIVFQATEEDTYEFLYCRTINYGNNERVYLKRGATYKVFAIANLDDANCPDDEEVTADTYFDDVKTLDGLAQKYFISAVEQPGAAPDKMPMISGTTESPFETVVLPERLALDGEGKYPVVTLPLRRLYTKVAVNIYNHANSEVDLVSYYANNIPANSWIVERANDDLDGDYPQILTTPAAGYTRSSLTGIGTSTTEGAYKKYNFDIYCLENRRGTVSGLTSTNVYDRKALAPEYAFEICFQGNVTVNEKEEVLQTYVVVGKGYDEVNTPIYNNFDVDRNCIYTVNIYVNGVGNVVADSRRMYLNVAINGELTPPEDGGDTWF